MRQGLNPRTRWLRRAACQLSQRRNAHEHSSQHLPCAACWTGPPGYPVRATGKLHRSRGQAGHGTCRPRVDLRGLVIARPVLVGSSPEDLGLSRTATWEHPALKHGIRVVPGPTSPTGTTRSPWNPGARQPRHARPALLRATRNFLQFDDGGPGSAQHPVVGGHVAHVRRSPRPSPR